MLCVSPSFSMCSFQVFAVPAYPQFLVRCGEDRFRTSARGHIVDRTGVRAFEAALQNWVIRSREMLQSIGCGHREPGCIQ